MVSLGSTASVGGGQPLGGGAGVDGQASKLSGTPSPSLSGMGVSVSTGTAVSVGIGIAVSVGAGGSVGGGVSVGAVVDVGKTKSVAVGGINVAVMKRVGWTTVKNCPGVFASVGCVCGSGVMLGNDTRVFVAIERVGSVAAIVAVVLGARVGAEPQSSIPTQ